MPDEGYQGEEAFLDWQQERARRVVKNERAFRSYNERREEFEKAAVAADELVPFVCECADTDCHASMELTVGEFEAGHAAADLFAVKPGHVFPEFEEVVARRDRYWIARKFDPDQVRRRLMTEQPA